MSELRYGNLTADLAAQCATVELAAFPTADPDELLSEEDFTAYARVFPEGCFVCIDGDRVVGQGAGILLDFDFDAYQHSIVEITGENQCGNHNPKGAWYYVTDIAVHPDDRRQGIGATLYDLRKGYVRDHDKSGIVAGGHLHGFGKHKHQMSAHEYIAAVEAGEIYDPTLTFQLHQGFEIVGALENYLVDEATDGWSALIVWRNTDASAMHSLRLHQGPRA